MERAERDDLTMRIEPRSGRVRSLLPQVLTQLESLVSFVRSLTDNDTTFEVVSITKSSPLVAVFRPVRRTNPEGDHYRRVSTASSRTAKTLAALLADAKLPNYVDAYALVHLRMLVDDLEDSGHFETITINGADFTVDDKLRERINLRLGAKRLVVTSFTGELDHVQVHPSRWSFTLRPAAGPERILCFFDKEELERVRGLQKEVVTVRGTATYHQSSAWPIEMRVDSLVIRPPAPDRLWNGLPSVLRNDWENAAERDIKFATSGVLLA